MNATAKNMLISVLGTAAGYSLYNWWRHGRVDWVGTLVFALGFGLATLAEQRIRRWWQNRKQQASPSVLDGLGSLRK